ncbi:acetate uptake transporter [Chitinilyticum piscinae]|uniref:Acetate uptake transporter n=1 Tax=Chitinilyticum piscinae TaxID=2866724 RepID=A0A8J7FJ09_9NEIS|nr:acetate uptake transporter [Chitinilyticum piscinae]MBE9608717.1 acetate uptake transporter [Chitinilyticum piscinae]
MAPTSQETIVRDQTSNPAPLGLLGFGMTTILLNLHNIGLFGLSSMILAMGIFYGGIAQVIAGVMEWKKGNTFGTAAFTSYGLFWLSLVALILMGQHGVGDANSAAAMGSYMLMWGLFTACLFICTLRMNRATQVIFGSLVLLFLVLAVEKFTGNEALQALAGWIGLFCGGSAFYSAIAQIMNEVHGRDVLPLGQGAH